jgi:segregation and condensation protein B
MELKDIIEAILFNAQRALTAEDIRNVINDTAKASEDPQIRAFSKIAIENVQSAIEQIKREFDEANRAFRLICVAGAWQFASRPEFSPWMRTLYGQRQRPPKLSQPALETLAIIAYRQPVTRAEIEQIRGVAVDGVIQTLLERGLIEQSGKADLPGRPALYSTTQAFLEYFGLRSLEDLPAADELRRLQVQKPEKLLTVENGNDGSVQGQKTDAKLESKQVENTVKPEDIKNEDAQTQKTAAESGAQTSDLQNNSQQPENNS